MDLDSARNSSCAGCQGNGTDEASRQHSSSYISMATLLITVATSAVSLVTILGNLLVLISVRSNRHLQTINNYFLFSLACADLLLGAFSMNVYGAYVLLGRWPFGPITCPLWLVLDYVVSNASNMHLLLISVDRYLCVTRPLSYPSRRTPRYAVLMLLAAWVLSLVLWAPAILTWQRFHGQHECYIQLLSSPSVTLATAVPSFYLPAALMTLLYARISRAGRCRHSDQQRQSRAPHSAGDRRASVRERKVTRTVLAVLLAFLVTWTPYNILVVVGTFCHCCVWDSLWSFGYWLRYLNSTINPACYALCNATFRNTFRKLLLCQYKNINSK